MFSKAFKANNDCHLPAGSSAGGQFCSDGKGKPSGGGGSSFEDLLKLPMMDRKAKFNEMSRAQRDQIADSRKAIQGRVEALTGQYSMEDSGDLGKDLNNFIDQFSEDIPRQSRDLAKKMGGDLLKEMNSIEALDPSAKRRLTEDLMRNVLAQDIEAQSRTLGDHGVHHIYGDADLALDILSKIPGSENTPENRLMMIVAAAYHDTGYLTDPSRNFLDEDHPRWGAQHFNEHIAEDLKTTMGKNWVDETARLIASHAETSLDWDSEPLKTALSAADNLALFHKEKMPPMARFVTDNVKVLVDMARNKLNVDEAKDLMRKNIEATDLPRPIKDRFLESINEVSGFLPKFTIGMVGNELSSVSWKDNALHVSVKRNQANKELSKVLDMGQKQFSKMTETYGKTSDELLKTGRTTFVDDKGITRMIIDLFDTSKKVDSWLGFFGLSRLFK